MNRAQNKSKVAKKSSKSRRSSQSFTVVNITIESPQPAALPNNKWNTCQVLKVSNIASEILPGPLDPPIMQPPMPSTIKCTDSRLLIIYPHACSLNLQIAYSQAPAVRCEGLLVCIRFRLALFVQHAMAFLWSCFAGYIYIYMW